MVIGEEQKLTHLFSKWVLTSPPKSPSPRREGDLILFHKPLPLGGGVGESPVYHDMRVRKKRKMNLNSTNHD
jgi:hypothetical protein